MSIHKSIGLLSVALAMALSGCVMDVSESDDGSELIGSDTGELIMDIGGFGEDLDETQDEDLEVRRSETSTILNDTDLLLNLEPDPEPWMNEENSEP